MANKNSNNKTTKRKDNFKNSQTTKNTKNNSSKQVKETKSVKKNNKMIMDILIILGVLILAFIIIYLMNYFFVEKNNLKINMSTDKKLEYITIAGNEELITTQKYVSDLSYSMRYDVSDFSVFKYKEQDIFKFAKDERVLVVIEKSEWPKSCTSAELDLEYNSCVMDIDDYTRLYYISAKNLTYKITIKYLNLNDFKEVSEAKINYMLNSFEIANNG